MVAFPFSAPKAKQRRCSTSPIRTPGWDRLHFNHMNVYFLKLMLLSQQPCTTRWTRVGNLYFQVFAFLVKSTVSICLELMIISVHFIVNDMSQLLCVRDWYKHLFLNPIICSRVWVPSPFQHLFGLVVLIVVQQDAPTEVRTRSPICKQYFFMVENMRVMLDWMTEWMCSDPYVRAWRPAVSTTSWLQPHTRRWGIARNPCFIVDMLFEDVFRLEHRC